MADMKSFLAHEEFIGRTDRRSLFTQLKGFVDTVKTINQEDLKNRRRQLRQLLEYEDTIYEEEFANKVKSRIDEDIKTRRDVLLKIKQENAKTAEQFLKSKRIQQNIENCYEIREALRRKDVMNVKEAQLEQILINQRAKVKAKEENDYWLKVMEKNREVQDKRQREEDCLKARLALDTKLELDRQMCEAEEKREEERREKEKEAMDLAKLLNEIRLEEIDKKRTAIERDKLKYRKDLEQMIEEKRRLKAEERCNAARLHIEMMENLQRIEREEQLELAKRKIELRKTFTDFIAYVKRLRKLDEDMEAIRNKNIDEESRVDQCTKRNLKVIAERKAAEAAAAHAELKEQVCQEAERRLREQAESREQAIYINPFGRDPPTREQILENKRKRREELAQQIEVLNAIRAEEQKKFESGLSRAFDSPEECRKLAEEYMCEGVDYLMPHPNWWIFACPTKQYVPKKTTMEEMPQPTGDSCIDYCGCKVRSQKESAEMPCTGYKYFQK